MTGPPDPDRPLELDAYIAEQAGRYTDEAMSKVLVAAGYQPHQVRAALAAAARLHPKADYRRAISTILIAYVAVFAVLSAGMLLNSRSLGMYVPTGSAGVQVLGVSLVVAFAASLIWIASRRVFLLIGAAGLLVFPPAGIAAIGLVLWLGFRPGRTRTIPDTTLGVLLVIPVILLIGVAGICVLSGSPIPGS